MLTQMDSFFMSRGGGARTAVGKGAGAGAVFRIFFGFFYASHETTLLDGSSKVSQNITAGGKEMTGSRSPGE